MLVGNKKDKSMNYHNTDERNVQIVIALLKAHNIHRVIASPGTTNMTFVVSVQNDPWFQVWSSADERSAAYLACGMAAETGEPVVISCTGATASRNYMSGLTEAFYRKLPILAITSTRGHTHIGHLGDQQIDRRSLPNDIAVESVNIPMVKDKEDERYCEIEVNKAILALKFNGGGPSHINLYTGYSTNFSIKEIPYVNAIYRHTVFDADLPKIPKDGRVVVFIGSHQNCSDKLSGLIDRFCATNDAVVFCDQTSGYRGKYEVHSPLLFGQKQYQSEFKDVNLCIHIGEVSGCQFLFKAKNVWRVSPDGQLRDTWKVLRRVFMMPEEYFFDYYSEENTTAHSFLDEINAEEAEIMKMIPDLPFGNIWIAQHMVEKLPARCELHLGIYNSLRSWNFFKLPADIYAKCNVGGFGIDGCLSTMIGASMVHPDKLFIGVFGDLAFFYDINVLGNRHVGSNVRILLINNGKGTEFRNYNHPCYFLKEDADSFIAAAGHYGNKSDKLVKHYAEDLGFIYLTASDKEGFEKMLPTFIQPNHIEKPILFEVFTNSDDESIALETMLNLVKDNSLKTRAKTVVKDLLGDNIVGKIKKVLR